MFHSDLAKSLEKYKFELRGLKILYQRQKISVRISFSYMLIFIINILSFFRTQNDSVSLNMTYRKNIIIHGDCIEGMKTA